MLKITGKRSDLVRKIVNFALKRASIVILIRNCVTQNCHIQVPKKHVKIKLGIYNFAKRLKVTLIDCKKSFKFKEHRQVGFLFLLFFYHSFIVRSFIVRSFIVLFIVPSLPFET